MYSIRQKALTKPACQDDITSMTSSGSRMVDFQCGRSVFFKLLELSSVLHKERTGMEIAALSDDKEKKNDHPPSPKRKHLSLNSRED